MNCRILPIIILGLMLLSFGCDPPNGDAPSDGLGVGDFRLKEHSEYRVIPFVRAVVSLQESGRESACETLWKMVMDDSEDKRIYYLCRMLFVNREGSEFRRPGVGSAGFIIRGTTYSDWPLEPIELIDGVPFRIVLREYGV